MALFTIHNVIPGGKAIVVMKDYIKVYEIKGTALHISLRDNLHNGTITLYDQFGIISEIKQFYIDGTDVIMGESPYLFQGKYKLYNLEWRANIEWI